MGTYILTPRHHPSRVNCLPQKIQSRAQYKLYIIRRSTFLSTLSAILPQFSHFTDKFTNLPIEKQAQSRSFITFFTYFTYFTNKKALHRIHKKKYGNMILPIFAVESVKYRWKINTKIFFIFFLFFYLTFIFICI